MKIRIINLILLLLAISLMGCGYSKNEQNEDVPITYKIDTTFKNYNRNVESSIFGNANDSLKIKVYVHSPYYVEESTNKLILSFIASDLFDEFKKYDFVGFIWISEGFEHDPLLYSLNKQELQEIKNHTNSNPIFKDIVMYVLNNFSQDEYLYANYIISETNRLVAQENPYNGNFWMLLYSYSRNNISDSTAIKFYKKFSKLVVLDSTMFNDEYINEIDDIVNDNR